MKVSAILCKCTYCTFTLCGSVAANGVKGSFPLYTFFGSLFFQLMILALLQNLVKMVLLVYQSLDSPTTPVIVQQGIEGIIVKWVSSVV